MELHSDDKQYASERQILKQLSIFPSHFVLSTLGSKETVEIASEILDCNIAPPNTRRDMN